MSFVEKILSQISDQIMEVKPWIGSSLRLNQISKLLVIWAKSLSLPHIIILIITTTTNYQPDFKAFDGLSKKLITDYFYTDALRTAPISIISSSSS